LRMHIRETIKVYMNKWTGFRACRDLGARLMLKEKMILSFAATSTGIVVLTGVLHYYMTASRILKEAEATTVQMVGNACQDINELFLQTFQVCSAMNDNISMQKPIRRQFRSIKEMYSYDLEGSMEMMVLPSYNRDIFGVYVLGDNGGRYKSNSSSFLVSDPRDTDWYRIIHATGQAQWFPPHENSYVVSTPYTSYVSMGIPFIDKATGRTKGVVLADIDSDKLSGIAARAVSGAGDVFLMDERNRIMNLTAGEGPWKDRDGVEKARRTVEENLSEIPEYGVSHVLKDKGQLVVYQTLNQTDWKIVGVIPKASITRSAEYIKVLMIMLLALAVVISMILSEIVAESVTRPLFTLVKSMEQVCAGNLETSVKTERRDEIGVLYDSFNHMTGEMRNLIDTIYREQEKLRREELKALQAQINPHFLYNTLDSIIWSLRMRQVEESIEMLTALTDFFKISLSKGRDIITIEEEVKHIKSYLSIQHRRYLEKFDYDINVDPAILSCRTPKLILQPAVENAIYHGIKPMEEKGYIYIHIFPQGGDVLLQVQDTGMGMDKDACSRLNRELDTISSDQQGTGYGVRNVNDKIKIVYGRRYGVTIESAMGEGTVVTLRIGKKGETSDESDYL